MNNNRGFTLVELIIAMACFIVILILVGTSFNLILSQSLKLMKSEESNIEGVVGLELLRHDLNLAGYGLSNDIPQEVSSIGEASVGISMKTNDPFNVPPRPIVILERNFDGCPNFTTDQPDDKNYHLIVCSDYLSIKATNLGASAASQHWTYLTYNAGSGGTASTMTPNIWKNAADNPSNGDAVVVLRKNLSTSTNSSILAHRDGSTSPDFHYTFGSTAFNNMTGESSSPCNVYGIDSGATVRMPFNRADYFVAQPFPITATPSLLCAPGTGTLYKATVNQADGKLTYIPLLPCVAGMQVVLGWDYNGDGLIDTWSNADGSTVSDVGGLGVTSAQIQAALSQANNPMSANQPNIWNNLKTVKVYILAQNGRKDLSYKSPSPIIGGDPGEMSLTRSYDIAGSNWSNYRWKLYKIVVNPRNLVSNQ